MDSKDIEKMLAERGKPCVSIIIPTKRLGREREQNHELVEKAIKRAQILVKHSPWTKEQIQLLLQRLSVLQSRIEQLRLEEGLAIFISPEIFKIYCIPVSVTEKVILGDSFEFRDLIYINQFLRPYYLLTVSRRRVRLFKGSGRELQEILNDDFPRRYADDYEYSRPAIASSSSSALKSFERDRSILSDTRTRAFFQQADGVLNKYLDQQAPLFVAGVEEEIADFEKVTAHSRQIKGKIRGNYDVDAVHPLAETAWSKIKREVQIANSELLLKLDDAVGRHLAVDGLVEVWKAANEGRGHILLLEKDYVQRAYLKPGDKGNLLLGPPVGEYEIIHDAADDVIEIVKAKGGNVLILENGELKDFKRIALILRYATGS